MISYRYLKKYIYISKKRCETRCEIFYKMTNKSFASFFVAKNNAIQLEFSSEYVTDFGTPFRGFPRYDDDSMIIRFINTERQTFLLVAPTSKARRQDN